MIPKLLIVIVLTLHVHNLKGQIISIRFAKEDFGFVNESENSFVTLVVEKDGISENDLTVIIELQNSTSDFLTDSWPVLFSRSDTTFNRSVDVFILDDDIPEKDETFEFSLRLTSSRGVVIGEPRTAHVTISANDNANGVIGFDSVGPVKTQELSHQNGTTTLALRRSRGLFGDVTVTYSVSGNQNARNDIYPLFDVVSLSEGESFKEFGLFILDDEIPENDEDFRVTLVDTGGGLKINETSNIAAVVIGENDSPLRFAKKLYRIEESETTLQLTVYRGMDKSGLSRVGPDHGLVFVEYQINPGTANFNTDYHAQEKGVLLFKDQEHEAKIQIYIKDDDEPELSENFTVQLLSNSINGDAIVADPSKCTIVIETNDNARGALSIDFSNAEYGDIGYYFLANEDESNRRIDISVVRLGGSFSTVSVQWMIQFNVTSDDKHVFDVVTPSSGTIMFEPNQKRVNISMNILDNEIPEEAKLLLFKLLPGSWQGGAVLESPFEAQVIVTDSDDVYGVFSVDRNRSYIEVNSEFRQLVATVSRSGGLVGDVQVKYLAYYLPPGTDGVKNALPGILSKTEGALTFIQDESTKVVNIGIANDAFLQIGSKLMVMLDSVELVNRELLISAQTPKIFVETVMINVTEQYANGEIGFSNKTVLTVDEPDAEPLTLTLELRRKGLSGAAIVQLSYRDGMGLEKEQDYVKGPDVITFKPGQKVQEIDIQILPDQLPELEERLIVRLDSITPSNQKLNRQKSETTVIIRENDDPGGIFSFSGDPNFSYVIEEDGTETINVVVERSEGALARRMIRYDVIPNGSRKFYGVPEVLIFLPGQRKATISLVSRDDDIPELDTNYTLVLQSYGSPPSVLAPPTVVHVTILSNDHPHGLFRFMDDVANPKTQVIGESKLDSNHTAYFGVRRSMGTFGNVSVQWKIVPGDTNDVTPTYGNLYFAENQTEDFILLQSSSDDLPESLEEFMIILFNATGGADIAEMENVTLIIQPNDKAIYFRGANTLRVREDAATLELTVHRDGSGADTARVHYRTLVAYSNSSINEHQATDGIDFRSIADDVIVFQRGVLDYDVAVIVNDDDLPEDDEMFYLELFDASDDYVAYGNRKVEIVILQSDDANGVFSLASINDVTITEGIPHSFLVVRNKGSFGDVSIDWKILRGYNSTYDEVLREMDNSIPESEFLSSEGALYFKEDVSALNITVTALPDHLPEYDEQFTLLITNATGGASLNNNTELLLVHVTVLKNDHPHGLLSFKTTPAKVEVAEDGDVESNVTIKLDRSMGSDGHIAALWELRTSNSSLPTRCKDFLLGGILLNGAEIDKGRRNLKTYTVKFDSGASVYYDEDLAAKRNENYSLSMWMKVSKEAANFALESDVPLVTKYDAFNKTIFSIKVSLRNIAIESVSYVYRNQADYFDTVTWSNLNDVANNSWNHILLTINKERIAFYYNGIFISDKKEENASITAGAYFLIGASHELAKLNSTYLLQDLRWYDVTLTSRQAKELHKMLAQNDMTPVNGYIFYKSDERQHNIVLHPANDSITEENEDFFLSIIDSTGGSEIDDSNRTVRITILKSDYANGLFGFLKPCAPPNVTEDQIAFCYVSRLHGLSGSVMVEWTFNFTEDETDFWPNRGSLLFLPGEKEKTFNVTSVSDGIPELGEEHVVMLTRATPLDGVSSSAHFSGAAIDDARDSQTVVVVSNDKPHGVLQFTTGNLPDPSDNGKLKESIEQPIQHVKEEKGRVTLIVERAAGWYGHVTCEWRTRDGSAVSRELPKDFEPAAGTLSFDDGQGYAELSVQLIDDEESELEKFFIVELLAPMGGASLNNASTVKVVIDASDDAFGIFSFNQTRVEVEEPAVGESQINLQINRDGGSLGNVTVFWRVRKNSSVDVTPLEGQILFNDGVIKNDIIINILADDQPEFDETIPVDLYAVSKGSIGSSSSCELIVLANDDPRGVFTFHPSSTLAYENDRYVTATILRSGGLAGDIRVFYGTMDTYPNRTTAKGIAMSGQDFSPVTDSVLFGENVTTVNISIPIYNDETPEADEIFFVQLLSTALNSNSFEVPNSPRLGSRSDTLMEVVIVENDSPHGVLELSKAAVTTQEDSNVTDASSREFLFVLRKLGSFGDVTVGFNVIPGTARAEEDFNIASNQVTLLEGEIKKAVPINIVDDFTPEVAEKFTVQLLHNSITGGARVGTEDSCEVTIDESDDPYGLFEISSNIKEVEEPSSGRGTPVTFTVTRRSGTLGLVGISWNVSVRPALSAAPVADGNFTQSLNNNDVDIQRGTVYFVTDEKSRTFVIKILPDNMPEDDELVVVKLDRILSGHKGRINPRHSEVHILISANDRPYGDVRFKNDEIMTHENDNQDDIAAIVVERSGGLYGMLRVVYSTAEIDLVSEILEKQQNIFENYLPSKVVDRVDERAFFQSVDITSSPNPRLTCAEACLRQKICRAFLYQSVSYECKWTNQETVDRRYISFAPDDVTLSPTYFSGRFSFYEKNQTLTSLLYNSQARSDLDFRPLSGASVLFHPGQRNAYINISIFPDKIPELKEYFQVNLLNLEMVDFVPDDTNQPTIKSPSSARITIQENDYPYGLFILSGQGKMINKSLVVEVQERSKLSLELVVERQGGSVGTVTVDWTVIGGTAERNIDFNGDDATLKFAHGETNKVISLSVIDDAIPEPDETIQIQLHNPTGGAVLNDLSGRGKVIILANDVVGGVIGFASVSKSLIAQEGDTVMLQLIRSEPALGRCLVTWHGVGLNGHNIDEGLNVTNGVVTFAEGQISEEIYVHVVADSDPETKESYKIILDQVETTGISASGSAILNAQSYEAEISIQESDDPHGVFQFAPDSQRINAKEDQKVMELHVTRQFGSIGNVRVYFDVIPGTLSTVNPDVDVAQPGADFTYNEEKAYILFEDGVTSTPIVMNITNDDVPELVEIFHVNITRAILVGPDGEGITALLPPKIDADNSISQIVIDANDGTKGEIAFNISSTNIYTTEGSIVQLNIFRDKGAYGEVSVFIYPQNKEAEQGADYICDSKTLVFPDSQRSISYDIEIVDDVIPEGSESFVVLLGNPSTGLQLGNNTVATVTIASNDDAHGRLSFSNEALIRITEPEGLNFNNSVATLVVKRNPTTGLFGEVSVRYRVREIAANGAILHDARIDDVTPTEGYVTIEDGVSETTLEITAESDSRPELKRKYRVTLFDPGQGATLDNNQTFCEIVVGENDAPYGFFQVNPSGIRNSSRMVRVNEGGNRLISVDIVRRQGTLGFVTLELETVSGSATSLPTPNQHPPYLVPFQIFARSSGTWFHAFHHTQHDYLVYLTNELISPLTTAVGSSGTLTSLAPGIHSTLYRWEGVYVPMQTIETDGASCATTFTINDVLYLVITNSGSTTRRETMSRLYSFNGEGLQVVQDISTKGASHVLHFRAERDYLVVANSVDANQISTVDSILLRYDDVSGLFEEQQSLPTRGAAGLTTFSQNNQLYLVIANSFDSEIQPSSRIPSVVYKWNVLSLSFVQPRSVDVSRALDVQNYNVDGRSFLVFTTDLTRNKFNQIAKSTIQIFQVFQGEDQDRITLRSHQLINVTGATRTQLKHVPIETFTSVGRIQAQYLRNNSILLMLVPSLYKSHIFIFNYKTLLFNLLLDSAPSSFMQAYIVNERTQPSVVVAAVTSDVLPAAFTSSDGDASKSPINYNQIKSFAVYDLLNVHKSNETMASHNITEGDYIPLRKTLSFNPGETVLTVIINLLDDNVSEDEETFKIALSNTLDKRAIIDDVRSSLDIVIEANDDAYGIIGFDEDSSEKRVEETSLDNVFSLNVIRRKASFGRVSVDWFAEGSVKDVTPVTGQVIFEKGQTKVSIQMTVLADDVPEVEETVRIQLRNPKVIGGKSFTQPGLNSSRSTALVRIPPNDSPHGQIRWAPNSLRVVVNEAEKDVDSSKLVTLEMIREQGTLGNIEVHFRTARAENLPASSQASPGLDFIPRDSSLIMRENSTRAAISISILPDDIPEDIESFFVVIDEVSLIGESKMGGKPGVAQDGSNVADISIDENDDARGFIQFDVTRNSENTMEAYELPRVNNSVKLPLVRSVGFSRTVGVEWIAQPITARNEDFFPRSGSVEFEANKASGEINIFILDDDEVEFLESFTVQLIGTTGGVQLGGNLVVTVNILPNDSPSGMFGFLQAARNVKESSFSTDPQGIVEFTVRRFQGSDDEVTLLWELEKSARNDLSPTSGRLTFPPGSRSRSIVLRTIPDQELEGEEVYSLTLLTATGGAEISPVAREAKIIIAADPGAAGTVWLQTSLIYMGEPENGFDGKATIRLKRGPTAFGRVRIIWQITPADLETFTSVKGEAVFDDGRNESEILVEVRNDAIPELAQNFVLRLQAATGGAEISNSGSSCLIKVVSSDNPHGVFSFSQPLYKVRESKGDDSVTSLTDFTSSIQVMVIRSKGRTGRVSLRLTTDPGSAQADIDYYSVDKTLVFEDGITTKRVAIEIINDSVPEGPEEFFVNITDIRLLSHSGNDYGLKRPFNLTVDTPPISGFPSRSLVQIEKNDGAEGIVEFKVESGEVRVREEDEKVNIALTRHSGEYGKISVVVNSINQTARRNVDFLMPSNGVNVVFQDGQKMAFINVTLIDDQLIENEEMFTLAITSISTGGRIGRKKFLNVIISKSEYPNGVMRFVGENHITIQNPNSEQVLRFNIERFGGNQLSASVKWKILRTPPYIFPTTRESLLSGDIGPPTSGMFLFNDNQGGQREIFARVLAASKNQEVEEHFALILTDADPAEISQEKGNVTITVLKKGHPNGVVRFGRSTDGTFSNAPQIVEEPQSGASPIAFPVTRALGSIGPLNITWSITPQNSLYAASGDDLSQTKGFVIMRNSQIDADLIISVKADNSAELDEVFFLTLSSVDGGGEIDGNHSISKFVIRANDNPHGIFSVYPDNQLIVVTSQMARLLRVNVTREKGSFDSAAVEFLVDFDEPIEGTSYVTTNTGSLIFSDGVTWLSQEIAIPSSVFLNVGDTFTVQLTSVEFIGESLSNEPKISTEHSTTKVSVSDQAGNAQVGFEPKIVNLQDVKNDICRLSLFRRGLFGDVTIHWTTGFSTQSTPSGFTVGRISPSSGVINMVSGMKRANFTVEIFPHSELTSAFAIHLSRVSSPVGGGAKILKSHENVEIDPCGAVHFTSSSLKVDIAQNVRQLNLTVTRKYGTRFHIQVSFDIVPLSSLPGTDYLIPDSTELLFKAGQRTANITILIPPHESKRRRRFQAKLTKAVQPQNIYGDISPRILMGQHISRVTILESRDAHGYFSFQDATIRTKENSDDGLDVLFVMVTIKRTTGALGYASVVASTSGETNDGSLINGLDSLSKRKVLNVIKADHTTKATGNVDYEMRSVNVSFPEGTNSVSIPVVILNDDVSEPDEAFFVFLHSPFGGAKVDPKAAMVKIVIDANDNPNGLIGFMESAYTISEDPDLLSIITLRRNHAFGNVSIKWRVVGDDHAASSITSLSEQLDKTRGLTICYERELNCEIKLHVKDDNEAEFARTFVMEIYEVSEGAEIDPARKFANVTIADSDYPWGLFQFAPSSRLPVVTKDSQRVGMTVQRIGGTSLTTKVRLSTKEVDTVASIAGVSFYRAVADVDFVSQERELIFEKGQQEVFLSVNLLPESQSPNPLPKMFQVVLESSDDKSSINEQYRVANVSIFDDDKVKRVWRVFEALQQELNEKVLQNVLVELRHIADEDIDENQIKIFQESLNQVLKVGRRRRLAEHTLNEIYELFCKLLEPSRTDAVRSHSQFIQAFDQFALSLTTDTACLATDAISFSLSSCEHAVVQSSRWYPELINGYAFNGKGRGYFQIPNDLLDASSNGAASSNPQCFQVYFLELSSAIWFELKGEKDPMSQKVFSIGVDGKLTHKLSTPVRYRVYTNDARISPQGAECVIWNQASSHWFSSAQESCRVVDDSSNYVECECYHMSVYAARGPTDNLVGYNSATYAASFISMTACFLAPLFHFLCSGRFRFATKLLMHLLISCAATQLFFVVSAFTSDSARPDVSDLCAAMALLFHYFWLSQFTWMLAVGIHLLQALSFNKQPTNRGFLAFFLLGWGFPIVVVLLYVIFMYAFDRGTSIYDVYGDVHDNSEMCAIMNPYGAILSAVFPACLSVLALITIVLHLYKKEGEWKRFDDVFYGRFNSKEVQLLCWLFFLISFTWLNGGLHLRFGYLWMLILFIASNFVMGFYILVVYDIFRCPILTSSSTLYDGGMDKADVTAQEYQTASFGAVPSISGDVINKSTQSLMKIDDEWQPNENQILAESIMGLTEASTKEDGIDFDDLISALNMENEGQELPPDVTFPKEVEAEMIRRRASPVPPERDGHDSFRKTKSGLADTHL